MLDQDPPCEETGRGEPDLHTQTPCPGGLLAPRGNALLEYPKVTPLLIHSFPIMYRTRQFFFLVYLITPFYENEPPPLRVENVMEHIIR